MYFNIEHSDGRLEELSLLDLITLIKFEGELDATLKIVDGKLLIKIKVE
jgi:hypothetical protein